MSHLSEEQLDQIIAAERSREQAPLNEWRTIAARAREEGLIRETQSSRWWASSQPWLQSAAAVLLLVGGIAIGRATIALPSVGQGLATSPTVPATTASTSSSASTGSDVAFASVDDASAALKRSVDEYQRAAALDKIENATVSALRTAPHDPVLNQYYLATMGARVATQQLVARPVGLRGF